MLPSVTAVADFNSGVNGTVGHYNPHSLGDFADSAIPLLSIRVSASTDLMKGNALDVVASYRSVGVNQNSTNLQYNELSTEFSVTAPRFKSLDFSQAIREKVEICPEKLIDKMIIDGAVGFNYQW